MLNYTFLTTLNKLKLKKTEKNPVSLKEACKDLGRKRLKVIIDFLSLPLLELVTKNPSY